MAIILKNIPSVTGIRMRTYQVDTYELVTSASSVDEGLTFTITINTANVADGTLVPYTITGVTSSDIDGAPLTGNFVITGGTDTIEFLTSRDFITEGPEYMTITLDNGRAAAELLINVTSRESDPYWHSRGTVLLLTGEGTGQYNPEQFIDLSSNAAELTTTAAGPYTHGYDLYNDKFCYHFDDAEYLAFNTSSAFNIGTKDASVELFVCFDTLPVKEMALCGQNPSNQSTLRIYVNAAGRLGLHINNDYTIILGPTIVVGKWHHCVGTYSAGVVRFIVDGVLQSVRTGVASINVQNVPYYIGNDEANLLSDGPRKISNFRYCVGAIPSEYQTTSMTVGEKIFDVPTGTLPATPHTVLLTAQTPYVADMSSYKHGQTSNCKTMPFSPFERPEVPEYGIAYFPGSAMVKNTTSTAFNFGTGAFTVETWVFFNELVTGTNLYDAIIGSTSTTNGFQLYKAATTNDILYGATNSAGKAVAPSSAIKTKQWNHFAVVRSSTAANATRVYLNGRLQYTYTDTQNYNINGIEIGGFTTTSQMYLPGWLGPTRVVKGAALYTADFIPAPLTNVAGTSLLLNFNKQAVNEISSGRAPTYKTWNITADTNVKKYGDRSLKFNGNSRIDTGYSTDLNFGSGNFTIELWINASSGTGVIINNGGGLNIAYSSYILSAQSGILYFAASTSNTKYEVGGLAAPAGELGALPLNQWVHVAVTRSGNTYSGYINGIRTWQQTVSGALYDPTPRGLMIGASVNNTWGSTPQRGVTGYIDDLRITKGVARYTSTTFAPPDRLPTA